MGKNQFNMKHDPYFKFVAVVVLSGVVLALASTGKSSAAIAEVTAQAPVYTASIQPASPVETVSPAQPAPVTRKHHRLFRQKPVS